jgi:O-antigen/teichoic acid export membrane protein
LKDQKVEGKRLVVNSIYLYVMMVITTLVGLYTSRVVLSSLGFTDFGIYNVVGGVVTLIGFIQTAMGNASWRFITMGLGDGDVERLHIIFNTAMILHALFCVVLVIVCETIGLWFMYNYMQIPPNRLNDAFWVFQFSIATIVIAIMSSPYNSVILAHEHMSVFAYISVFESVARLGVALSLVCFLTQRLVVYGLLLLIVQIIIRVLYTVYCNRHFAECKLTYVFDKKLFKRMLSFTNYNLVAGLGLAGCGQGLNVLLSVFFNPTVNAARGISVQVQSLLTKFVSSFLQATNPQITKLYADHQLERMHQLVNVAAKFSFFMVILIAIPLFLEMKPILLLWLKSIPDYTVNFCRIMLFIAILDTIANPFLVGAAANGHIRMYYTVTGLLLIAVIPISYIALKLGCNPIAVYVVHLLVSIIVMAWRILYGARLINYPWMKLLKEIGYPVFMTSIVSCGLSILLWQLMPSEHLLVVLEFGLFSCMMTLACICFMGMNKAEKNFVIGKIKKHYKR